MRLITTKEELTNKKYGCFDNEVGSVICFVNDNNEGIDEVLFTGFLFSDIRELLYIIQQNCNAREKEYNTGEISFQTDGILYRKTNDKLKFRRQENDKIFRKMVCAFYAH